MTQTEYGCGVVPEYGITTEHQGWEGRWIRSQRTEWDRLLFPRARYLGYWARLERRLILPDGTAGEWEVIDSVNCEE